MKKLLAMLALALLGAPFASAETYPAPAAEKYVTDLVGLLSPSGKDRLVSALSEYERNRSSAVVFAIVPGSYLGEMDIDAYSLKLANSWGIGSAARNNGVLVTVAIYSPEKRKMRIEVGRGLTGHLTNAEASRIIREVVAPYTRKGQWDEGLMAGATAIMHNLNLAAAPETRPQTESAERQPSASPVPVATSSDTDAVATAIHSDRSTQDNEGAWILPTIGIVVLVALIVLAFWVRAKTSESAFPLAPTSIAPAAPRFRKTYTEPRRAEPARRSPRRESTPAPRPVRREESTRTADDSPSIVPIIMDTPIYSAPEPSYSAPDPSPSSDTFDGGGFDGGGGSGDI